MIIVCFTNENGETTLDPEDITMPCWIRSVNIEPTDGAGDTTIQIRIESFDGYA